MLPRLNGSGPTELPLLRETKETFYPDSDPEDGPAMKPKITFLPRKRDSSKLGWKQFRADIVIK